MRNMLHALELRGMERLDRAEYPRPALREAVLNALPYLDYGQQGDRVRIYLFSDRVEVHSPGGLGRRVPACGCRLDNLLTKRWSRNGVLVQGLVALDIIEESGFGLDRMVAAMVEAGLPAPVFANTGDTFVVTLYGAAAHLRTSLTPHTRRDVPVAASRPRQPERQAWALEHLRREGPLSPRACAAVLGVSVDTAVSHLRSLVEQGLVRAEWLRCENGGGTRARDDRFTGRPGHSPMIGESVPHLRRTTRTNAQSHQAPHAPCISRRHPVAHAYGSPQPLSLHRMWHFCLANPMAFVLRTP